MWVLICERQYPTTKYRITVHSLQEKNVLCILSFNYCGTFPFLYKCLHYINFYEILSRFALLFWRSGSFFSFGLRCLRPAIDRGKQPTSGKHTTTMKKGCQKYCTHFYFQALESLLEYFHFIPRHNNIYIINLSNLMYSLFFIGVAFRLNEGEIRW